MTTAVEWAATRHATSLGHHWVGEEHLLLAVAEETDLNLPELVTALASHLERHGPPVPKAHEGCASAPSYHLTCGRAEGLALAEGVAVPEAGHVLRALLWDPQGVPTTLLGRADNTVPRLPSNPLRAPAEREAVAMGYPFFSSEHVVLALLAGQPDHSAGEALRACGLEHDLVAAKLLKSWTDGLPPCPPHGGVTSARPNPRSLQLLGRAEGLAGGTATVRSQHGLIAFLWCHGGISVFELESWGTTGPAVVDALNRLGLALPPVPRPEPDRTPWGEPVFVPLDRYGDVVRALRAQLDAGTWGCNTHDDRAWVHGHAHIDMPAIVERVLAP
ncbi:MAG: Clp protease N-terminal domain-containing protein [Acidimicrobiales bacterium]